MTTRADRLVGRADELGSFEQVLDELDRGYPAAIELEGEPGIGKTRLLRELAARADAREHLVLSGSASELERDLPFSVFLDALDDYVASLEPGRLAELDEPSREELANVFPSLALIGRGGNDGTDQHERHRTHRAVRALLELLARSRPLVLVLDDVHWADPASVELLGTLLHRPPASAVLLSLAFRSRQVPDRLTTALERGERAAGLIRIELSALTSAEARELLGEAVDDAEASLLYGESGGNPFYLEQLARWSARPARPASVATSSTGWAVPAPVAASLNEELTTLPEGVRRMLEGAAVAGDPFEPDLAAAAAATSEAAAMHAVDQLLELDLVRATDVPRRFRFRHPLVRRAVYEATSAGWRLEAHERCAGALAARGANTAARAHHVERSAREGDLGAVALLREAGEAMARLAPESAARWFGAALRLLPGSAPVPDRIELLLARTEALAAAGRFVDAHEAVERAVALLPGQPSALRTTVMTACAGVERFLGRYEQAHTRLMRALQDLPEPASVERVELLVELTLNEFYRSRYAAMREWAEPAVSAARDVGDPSLVAAAAVMSAFAYAMTGPTDVARLRHAEAAALVDALSDDELSVRPHTAGWLAIGEVYLDLYVEADEHAGRALELTRVTGQGDPLHRLYPVLPRVWYVRGKLTEAAEFLDRVIETGRWLGSPPALAGNLFNRSVVALAAGELDLALAAAEESVELTRDLDEGFVSAWAAARLAAARFETGDAAGAVELLLGRAGGEEIRLIPGSWRACWLELLTRCWLELDRPAEAGRAADRAGTMAAAVQLPLARAWADRAAAAVALHAGDSVRAAERALASAETADVVGAPIESALSRVLAGRSLATAGDRDRAVEELQRAAAAFDACGAVRYRDGAERELGKLGHRPHRRTRPGGIDGHGFETLTERELQLARLVVGRKTNREIAADLFLSQKTVETHLRNIFHKMDVTDRVALARAVERADGQVPTSFGDVPTPRPAMRRGG